MTTINPGQFAAFPMAGFDSAGAPAAIHGTVAISDPDKAYLFAYPGGFDIVPKAPAPVGGSFMVSATVQAFSADGTPLSAVVVDLLVNGAPAPPQATTVSVGTGIPVSSGNTDYGLPTEATGGATISFSS